LGTGADLEKDLASGVLHSFCGVLFGEALTQSLFPASGGVKKISQRKSHWREELLAPCHKDTCKYARSAWCPPETDTK